MHYYYYCPETDTYELDDTRKQHDYPPKLSDPHSPDSSNDQDSFFGSGSDSSSVYHQNAIISAIPKHSESQPVYSFLAEDPSRVSAGRNRRPPHYARTSENHSDAHPCLRRSASSGSRKLTKPRPALPECEKRLSCWSPFSLLTAHGQPQAPTSQCSRHRSGACTCPPDLARHKTPRSTPAVLQIDTSDTILNDGLGTAAAPSSISSPASPLSRSNLRPTLSEVTSNRPFSDDAEKWHASPYQHTTNLSRRSLVRVSRSGTHKLAKRRPPTAQSSEQNLTSFVSFPLLPADLSPLPLSSIDIACAKLSPEPPPPLTLHEYLSSSKRPHRLSLRELADREYMADLLHAARPTSLPIQRVSPHQKWKTHRINFLSAISTPALSDSYRTNNRASSNTDALASLAWTGVVPSESGRTEESPYPSVVKTVELDTSMNMPREGTELKRGWTFAMAMADEVTDEVLVEQLEKMRNGPSSHNFSPSVAWMQHSSKHGDSTARTRSISSVHPHPHVLDRAHTERINNDLEDAATWRTARRALLCCREMVRTEKRYQEELKALLNGETITPPPALMLTYLPALLHASKVLLKGLSEDPSAWGVSAAFMGCEDELEAAMVAWSGVAGQFFANKRKSKSWKRMPASRSGSSSHIPTLQQTQTQVSSSSPPSATTSTYMPILKSKSSVINGGGGDGTALPPVLVLMGDKLKEEKEDRDRVDKAEALADDKASSRSDKSRKTERKLSVRDLAIQPTQRVMRYVMLYQDLLAHTPQSSPSRALVESALEAAQRIAQKCDRAQDNAAFLPGQTTTSMTTTTTTPTASSTTPTDSTKNPLRSFMSVGPTRQDTSTRTLTEIK